MYTAYERERFNEVKAKLQPQKGGVFLWEDDWQEVVSIIGYLMSHVNRVERENESLRKALQDVYATRQNDMGRN